MEIDLANTQTRLLEIESTRLAQAAELEKKTQAQAELESRFNSMVQNRLRAEQERMELIEEHNEKIKVLAETLLPTLKQDPLSVLAVLQSEINHLELAHLAVADAVKNSDSACELVITSPKELWSNNFIIMEAVILKVTYNKTLAQLLENVFPPDHLLMTMLNKVGR